MRRINRNEKYDGGLGWQRDPDTQDKDNYKRVGCEEGLETVNGKEGTKNEKNYGRSEGKWVRGEENLGISLEDVGNENDRSKGRKMRVRVMKRDKLVGRKEMKRVRCASS